MKYQRIMGHQYRDRVQKTKVDFYEYFHKKYHYF